MTMRPFVGAAPAMGLGGTTAPTVAPFRQLPGHPYVSYRLVTDLIGQLWVECKCSACPGHEWRRQCNHPERHGQHVLAYATYHGHGVVPVRR